MMWALLGVMVALAEAATSLNYKNVENSMPPRLSSAFHRPDLDPMEKLELGSFSEDFTDPNSARYQRGFEPFKKLSLLDESDGNTDEIIPVIEEDEDKDIDQLSAFLTKLLQEPGGWEAPLVLVEEPTPWEVSPIDNQLDGSDEMPTPWKRSRYYRRYPWKRQNSRTRYDDGSRYLCTPTREDVFQLLVALHHARQGNKSRTVNFCNRRRPAGAIFTNIRFLGRRK